MKRRRRILLLGLALVLLLAIWAALLLLKPSVAEQKAALLREGMTPQEVEALAGVRTLASDNFSEVRQEHGMSYVWPMEDGSRLMVQFGPGKECFPLINVRTFPPPPPLERLRNSLNDWWNRPKREWERKRTGSQLKRD